MNQIVALNNIDHAQARVLPGHGPQFGDAVNQVLAFPTEYDDLQREYPLLITRDGAGAWTSIALLGLATDENLYLDGDTWDARHIPAVQQIGPLSLAVEKGAQAVAQPEPVLHINLAHPRYSEGEGIPLYLEHGGQSPLLLHLASQLRRIHIGVAAMPHMMAAFAHFQLIVPVNMTLDIGGGTNIVLPEYFTIDAKGLSQLRGAELDALHQDGFLELAFALASSVRNMGDLVRRKQQRQQAA